MHHSQIKRKTARNFEPINIKLHASDLLILFSDFGNLLVQTGLSFAASFQLDFRYPAIKFVVLVIKRICSVPQKFENDNFTNNYTFAPCLETLILNVGNVCSPRQSLPDQ